MLDYIFLVMSGVVMGLIVAVPIGPVNLICIRRTLAFGPMNGFISGLGSALGDTVFAIVTGFGLTVIAQLISGYSSYLELIGGGMLVYFGVHNFIAKVETRVADKIAAREKGSSTLLRAMASTLVLTLTNPATLLGFAALFAGLGGLAGGHPNLISAAFVVIGVGAGAALWWLTLTTIVGRLHASINDHTMVVINRGSGIAIMGFGFAVLIHLAFKLLGL